MLFLGGGLGSIARVALGEIVQSRAPATFPAGTLAVNLIGCFAMGALAAAMTRSGWLSPAAGAFLAAGVLGGFTTFSAFGLDAARLVEAREIGPALVYVLSSLVGGIAAVALGAAALRAIV
jgi:CrcB protein